MTQEELAADIAKKKKKFEKLNEALREQ